MKSSRFFIKSNYIKNTKNDWVYCNGQLLCHQSITFLHLKSENLNKNTSGSISESDGRFNGYSTLSQLYPSKLKGHNLNVLFNLCQFKSCEIKTVSFENLSKFAIKLVPSGFLRSKKLYLLPDVEDSFTEWCGILTGFIIKATSIPNSDSFVDNKKPIYSTLQASKKEENIFSNVSSQDLYISLDDNDAYESNSQNEFYLVTVKPTTDSVKLNITGNYIIKLGFDSLELLEVSTRDSIHFFPYVAIRRFGAKENLFRLEAGRHCTTGNGNFIFSAKDAALIAENLKNNTRQMKLVQNQINNSCATLSKSSISEISLQVESGKYATINAEGRQKVDYISQNPLRFPDKEAYLKDNLQNNVSSFTDHNEAEMGFIASNNSCRNSSLETATSEMIPRSKIQSGVEIRPYSEIRLQERSSLSSDNQKNKHFSDQGLNKDESSKEIMKSANIIPINPKRPFIFDISPTITPRTKSSKSLEMQTIMEKDLPEKSKNEGTKSPEKTPSFQDINEGDSNWSKTNENSEMKNVNKQELPRELNDQSLTSTFHLSESNNTNSQTHSSRFTNISTSPLIETNIDSLELKTSKSNDSMNCLRNSEKELRPISSMSVSQVSSSGSVSFASNSPLYNSLPFSNKPEVTDYEVSESTFFKYRKLPKPPIRTTPPLSSDTRAISFTFTSTGVRNFERSESVSSPKKSPPPVLPKPKLKSPQEKFDQSSFKEFDEMLKNLNLSFC